MDNTLKANDVFVFDNSIAVVIDNLRKGFRGFTIEVVKFFLFPLAMVGYLIFLVVLFFLVWRIDKRLKKVIREMNIEEVQKLKERIKEGVGVKETLGSLLFKPFFAILKLNSKKMNSVLEFIKLREEVEYELRMDAIEIAENVNALDNGMEIGYSKTEFLKFVHADGV
jgi:hypothetical protein